MACWVKVNFWRSRKFDCDWPVSGGNGRASSGKQALVGRIVKTSLTAHVREARQAPPCV